MNNADFERLLRSAREMGDYEAGHGTPPARQTTYVGKVLWEVRVSGKIAWSLKKAASELSAALAKSEVTSYSDLVRLMMEFLNQSDEGFAELIDVPVGTLRGWKSGRRQPNGPGRKLLQITASNPMIVFRAAADERFSLA
jgi:DNA-binding transcriptional regulator YiaG